VREKRRERERERERERDREYLHAVAQGRWAGQQRKKPKGEMNPNNSVARTTVSLHRTKTNTHHSLSPILDTTDSLSIKPLSPKKKAFSLLPPALPLSCPPALLPMRVLSSKP
jgi:hypothetical protein